LACEILKGIKSDNFSTSAIAQYAITKLPVKFSSITFLLILTNFLHIRQVRLVYVYLCCDSIDFGMTHTLYYILYIYTP